MPMYRYLCQKCSHQFSQIVKMSDPNPTCPKPVDQDPSSAAYDPTREVELCGGETAKLIVRGSFQLKGSGWATDGYAG